MDLDQLPIELVYQILITEKYEDILNFCRTSKKYGGICRDEKFWQEKAKRRFGKRLDQGEGRDDKEGAANIKYLKMLADSHCRSHTYRNSDFSKEMNCVINAITHRYVEDLYYWLKYKNFSEEEKEVILDEADKQGLYDYVAEILGSVG